MSDLVKRLRDGVYRCGCDGRLSCERCVVEEQAAERIEDLEATVNQLLYDLDAYNEFVKKVRAMPVAYTLHIYENITTPREYDMQFISKEGLDQALAELDKENNE